MMFSKRGRRTCKLLDKYEYGLINSFFLTHRPFCYTLSGVSYETVSVQIVNIYLAYDIPRSIQSDGEAT